MEGVTGYVYRNAHHRHYPGISKYYTPFLAPRKKRGCSRKEKNDILPDHNRDIPLVPQVLTNSAEDFVRMARILTDLSYREVNLNLGCPSGTVVSRGRGSGFLKDPERLLLFFDQVFEEKEKKGLQADLSVKTRLGMEDPGEILTLMGVYNRFPISELTIHARVRQDMYRHPARLDAFSEALAISRIPVCYNGDLFSLEDGARIRESFPQVKKLMLGRGLIADPSLHEKILNNTDSGKEEKQEHGEADFGGIPRFRRFHDEILHGYKDIMSGEKNVLYKMKELWGYVFSISLPGDKTWKKIRKSASLTEYLEIIDVWFEEKER